MTRATELRPLSVGLDAVVGALKGGDVGTVKGVFGSWEAAVGEVIALHAKPVKFDKGTLLVEVDQPGWATQLRFLESEIRERLAQVGGAQVLRLSIRVAGAEQSGRSRR